MMSRSEERIEEIESLMLESGVKRGNRREKQFGGRTRKFDMDSFSFSLVTDSEICLSVLECKTEHFETSEV